jgi:hypothetical protein
MAEKHFKYTAAKTCKKTKSENQMKGKVKAKTITKQYYLFTLIVTATKKIVGAV